MRKWVWIGVIVVFLGGVAWGYRIPRPPTFTLPWTAAQVNQLNAVLQNLWKLQNGEFNLDIVTTSKTNAGNGDFWIVQTGATCYFQYKANNTVFTLTPTGY